MANNVSRTTDDPVLERIETRVAQLGEGFTVARALPTRQRRMVGAWCFLDHLGPVVLSGDQGMHVGAHPHTCLQTFTWMIEGRILHRDSLGSEQVIQPGQVNLMTAGHGIVHTEDSLPGERAIHAAQLWIALPPEHSTTPPAFDHYPELPVWLDGGTTLTLLAGAFAGRTAPTRLYSALVGIDLAAHQNGSVTTLELKPDFEYGILPLQGRTQIDQEWFDGSSFAYLGRGRSALRLHLESGARCLLLGGAPFEAPVTMWWNFVGMSKEYVAQAQSDWDNQSPRFGRVAGDEGRRLTAPRLPWPPDSH